MYCPFCAALDTRVADSRLAADGGQVRRRRECPACGVRFTTYETAELSFPRIVKKSGGREPFDEAKVRAGMLRALEKRPVSAEQVEQALAHIRRKLLMCGERELATPQLGQWVMEELRALDQVAYVRFASVYWSFENLAAFRELLERLEPELPPGVSDAG